MRESFEQVFKLGPRDLGLELVYDVAHNIAKIEDAHGGRQAPEAVRPPQGRHPGLSAGPPGDPGGLPEDGQPVLIPGDMGRSFVLVGTEKALTETFGSTCHGAAGDEPAPGHEGGPGPLHPELAKQGIVVRAPAGPPLTKRFPRPTKT